MDVKLPQLAEGVESGTVVSILVTEGQEIKKDQPFIELETQKAVGSIPAPQSGVVTKIHVQQGSEVTVGQTLISIDTGVAESAPPAAQSAQAASAGVATRESRTQSAAAAGPLDEYSYLSRSGMAP